MTNNTQITYTPLTADTSSSWWFDKRCQRAFVDDRRAGLVHSITGEDLIDDARAHLTPAQMVERKLVQLLRGNPLPVSFMLNRAGR